MDLPEAVRTRLVSLVAACLDEVAPLPPSLTRVARFAPARRARLGASAILAELGADDDLRERVATHVRTRAGADPVDVAALAWLERGEGWEESVADAERRLEQRAPQQARDEAREQRLRERLDEAEQSLREQRRSHRAALEELRTENATLRRRLGETRAADRTALTEAQESAAASEERAGRLDRELRQARAELARLEEQVASLRRSAKSDARTERDEVGLKARLLLDTIAEAAAGLRRELVLPAATSTPGERVEAGLEPPAAEPGPPLVTDPARLASYLALPQPRLLVDGYNVSKWAWPSQSLEVQRSRLTTLLAALVARTGAETTVVFDGGASDARGTVSAPRGVRVVFSPPGVIADDVLRDLAAAEPTGRVVVCVTDDRALGADLRRGGVRVAAASALVAPQG